MSITVVAFMAFGMLALLPVWLPVVVLVDLLRGQRRLPLARLGLFGVAWAWVELGGVVALFWLWVTGRGTTHEAHYRIQARWCAGIIRSLRLTTGLKVTVDGVDEVGRGPYVVLCRHASLADSIISCFIVNNTLGLAPRYVLKSDLQAVPCLDILGHRTPNAFVNRGSSDVSGELRALERMVEGLREGQAAVIFPEGSRANPAKRERELDRLEKRHPGRHAVLSGLDRMIPPKPAGVGSLLAAAPHADVLTVWHSGLDGLDTFGGILAALGGRKVTAHFVASVVPRAQVPSDERFVEWLDEKWMEMDRSVVEHENGHVGRTQDNG